MTISGYLRICGKVINGFEYVSGQGWETTRVPESFSSQVSGQSPTDFRFNLIGPGGNTLSFATPRIRRLGCGDPNKKVERLDGFLPFSDDAAEYEVRKGEVVLYRRTIPRSAPKVEISSFTVDDTHAKVSWTTEAQSNLQVSLACAIGDRTFPVTLNRPEVHSLEIDLRTLPGATDAYVLVRAADGVRSGLATSKSFQIAGKPPNLTISTPPNGRKYGFLEPATLAGGGTDIGGRSIADQTLDWHLDGVSVAKGLRRFVVTNISPGCHTVTLSGSDGGFKAETSVTIEVLQPTERDKQWISIFQVPRHPLTP